MAKNKPEIVCGLHSARLALEKSPGNVIEVNIQKNKKPSAELTGIIKLAEAAGIGLQEVTREYLDKLSGNTLHQGIVLKHRGRQGSTQMELDELLSANRGSLLLLVLDGIQDPHNLGACLRTANATGVDAVLISKDRSVSINATVSKVASGAAENTPIISVGNIARTLRILKAAGVWIVGTTADSDTALYQVDLTVSVAMVMGSEGKGLRRNTREHCDYLVKLPMHGVVESLNVSVATGICLYEALRQRSVNSLSV